ncbi:MAG: hypothetical protein ACYS17_16380 [Planctomycetota bacterium]|jgi:hypothetical protein
MTQPCTKEDSIDEIRDDVKTIIKVLNGNGEGGLVTRVAIHKTYFKLIAGLGGPLLVALIITAIKYWWS